MAGTVVRRLEKVNKELWVVLSMFIIALVLNLVVDTQRMMLSFYTLPTLGSAYLYGRRHATLTAFASVLMVILLTAKGTIVGDPSVSVPASAWLDISAWGGILVITGYLMGTMYDRKNAQLVELRETYNGVLRLLRHFISKDEYTEHHSYRVSVYATRIAAHLDLDAERIEDVRAAGLLHDIGKLNVSRDLLYKAAQFTRDEYEDMQRHVDKGVSMLETIGGSMRRVIPIVLAHHDKFDGIRLSRDARAGDSARVAHHLGCGRLRLPHERSPVSQSDVPLRRERRPGKGLGHRLRSAGRRRVPRRLSFRRDGRHLRGRIARAGG